MGAPIFATLSDEQLLAETRRLVANEHAATAALLESLMELDARRLYLQEGCSSLFVYCTQILHLAEGAAYNRIEAARAARRFPAVLTAFLEGWVTLTAIRLIAPHLTDDNHLELIEAVRHKSRRHIELVVARLRPRPACPTVIRRLAARSAPDDGVAEDQGRFAASGTPAAGPLVPERVEAAPDLRNQAARPGIRPLQPNPVTVLASDRFKLQVTIARETHDKLRQAQDLLRHANPTGDVATVLDRALTLLVADLERRRLAATDTPRTVVRPVGSDSRHIPAAVRRTVWRRDGGRCAFVGRAGRCRETAFLEFHHVDPFAHGGPPTAKNIELRCRAHNLYEASLIFGRGGIRSDGGGHEDGGAAGAPKRRPRSVGRTNGSPSSG